MPKAVKTADLLLLSNRGDRAYSFLLVLRNLLQVLEFVVVDGGGVDEGFWFRLGETRNIIDCLEKFGGSCDGLRLRGVTSRMRIGWRIWIMELS